jgi:putative FmdB family regulatory protein
MTYKLYDFHCTTCFHTFEDLYQDNDIAATCPQCNSTSTERIVFCNNPSGPAAMINPVRQKEIMMKGAEIRNKILGKTPWRKSSESQSS